jgi:hypothetical protein
MHIPRVWARESAEARLPDGRPLPDSAWGWGDDEPAARAGASERLARILDRIRAGGHWPEDRYGYGDRPPREEILEELADGPDGGPPSAVLTRNRYGAAILNAAHLLVLDVDIPPSGLLGWLRRRFGGADPAEAIRARLREALGASGLATFRVYRTAAGFRAIAVDREFDPEGDDVRALMTASGTDPAFARLCRARRSFRARLTPKPWRIGLPPPPGEYPRTDDALRRRFEAWLLRYEAASERFATCRALETIGPAEPSGPSAPLVALHDRISRSGEPLPLA